MISTAGKYGVRQGEAVLATIAGQYHFNTELALRLGLDGRWEAATEEQGQTDPNSGGTMLALSPEILYGVLDELSLQGLARVPLVQAFTGVQSEGLTVQAGIIYEL